MFSVNLAASFPSFLPLVTGVRGRGILRSSPRPGSEKFFGEAADDRPPLGRVVECPRARRPESPPPGAPGFFVRPFGPARSKWPERCMDAARTSWENLQRRRAGGTRRGRRPVSAPAFFAHRPCVLRCCPRYGSRSCELRHNGVLGSSHSPGPASISASGSARPPIGYCSREFSPTATGPMCASAVFAEQVVQSTL
jgi:hypothetical protein